MLKTLNKKAIVATLTLAFMIASVFATSAAALSTTNYTPQITYLTAEKNKDKKTSKQYSDVIKVRWKKPAAKFKTWDVGFRLIKTNAKGTMIDKTSCKIICNNASDGSKTFKYNLPKRVGSGWKGQVYFVKGNTRTYFSSPHKWDSWYDINCGWTSR